MLGSALATGATTHPSMSEAVSQLEERRTTSDRRAAGGPGRRAELARRFAVQLDALKLAARDAAAVIVLVAAIGFTVAHVRPIYAGKAPLAQQLIAKATPQSAVAPTPKDTSLDARIVNSPQFQRDRQAFAADLVGTGRMSQARADTIAYYAVREAYARGIPPAVIFGVMLTENAVFASTATSNVGAVGLMQIYPKIWLKELGKKFGTNLAVDSTNLKYGTYILSQYIKKSPGKPATPSEVNAGLLRYNGCVHGSNTPNCHTYPSKVKNYVEKEAEALCGDKSFYECITKPFVNGLFGKSQ